MTTLKHQKILIPVHEPSWKERLFFFISGILGSVPLTLFIDQSANSFLASLPDFYATFFAVVVLAPFVEEFSKAFPLFYRHGESMKSIFALGLLVGLGFGVFEFLTYVLVLGAPILSRLTGIFFHAASTSITAYGIVTRRTGLFYLIAVALHSSHNFFASLMGLSLDYPFGVNFWVIGATLPLIIAIWLSMFLYDKVKKEST